MDISHYGGGCNAALVTAMWRFVEYRYGQRPFFAGDFLIIGGHFGLLSWDSSRQMGFARGICAFYDRHECLLLLVPVSSNSVEWVADPQLLSDRLRIRRQEDDVVKMIPWRRNCIILVDSDGSTKYADISEDEFKEVIWNRNKVAREKLLQRGMQANESP